jgi:hypothetical protein
LRFNYIFWTVHLLDSFVPFAVSKLDFKEFTFFSGLQKPRFMQIADFESTIPVVINVDFVDENRLLKCVLDRDFSHLFLRFADLRKKEFELLLLEF